jgi:hypothetical protein
MRSLKVVIEQYRIDHGIYPDDHLREPVLLEDGSTVSLEGLNVLTTPTNYISSLFMDYDEKPMLFGSGSYPELTNKEPIHCWVLISSGPDLDLDSQNIQYFPWRSNVEIYDPTNGGRSSGDFVEFGGDYLSGDYTIHGVPWEEWYGEEELQLMHNKLEKRRN